MNSLEALDKIVEKYDWLGKKYCRLIGKGDELHKFNQTAFVECLVTPIKQDLERLEELEKENQELKEEYENLDRSFNSCHLDYENLKGENEQLEKENEDLKVFVDAYANARDELLIRNQKLEKAIEIVFKHLDLYITNEGRHCMALGCLCSETGINKEDYELLNEVSGE